MDLLRFFDHTLSAQKIVPDFITTWVAYRLG